MRRRGGEGGGRGERGEGEVEREGERVGEDIQSDTSLCSTWLPLGHHVHQKLQKNIHHLPSSHLKSHPTRCE